MVGVAALRGVSESSVRRRLTNLLARLASPEVAWACDAPPELRVGRRAKATAAHDLYRRVAILHFAQGRTLRDVAVELGETLHTIRGACTVVRGAAAAWRGSGPSRREVAA
jgi:predicted nucleic acid-binding protein